MKMTLMPTLLLLASTLLVSCTNLVRLAETHDIEYVPCGVTGPNPTTNTIMLENEKTLLLAALSNATTRSFTLCDCFPSCSFTFVGTDHALYLHGGSTLKLDTTREYICNRDDIQKLLRLIEDRFNKGIKAEALEERNPQPKPTGDVAKKSVAP